MVIFSHQLLHPQLIFYQKTPCMFDFGCGRPSTVVRNPTYAVLSRNQLCRELRARWGGGSRKVTNDDEGEGGGGRGHDTPQKWWRHLWTASYNMHLMCPISLRILNICLLFSSPRWQRGDQRISSRVNWVKRKMFLSSKLQRQVGIKVYFHTQNLSGSSVK